MKPWIAALFSFTVTVLLQTPVNQKIVALSLQCRSPADCGSAEGDGCAQSQFAPRQAQLQALNNEVEALRKQLNVA